MGIFKLFWNKLLKLCSPRTGSVGESSGHSRFAYIPRRCRQCACVRHCWQREMAVRQRDGGKLMGCSTCGVSLKTARSSDESPADVHTTLLAAGCKGSGNVPCRRATLQWTPAPRLSDARHSHITELVKTQTRWRTDRVCRVKYEWSNDKWRLIDSSPQIVVVILLTAQAEYRTSEDDVP